MKALNRFYFYGILIMILFSCKKPEFRYEQPPIEVRQYYESGGIGGHAKWWWNAYIDGKKLKLPDGNADFTELELGPALEPPNMIVKSGKDVYLIRVMNQKPEIMSIPENIRGPYAWTADGLGFVTRKAILDIRTGEITSLPEYKGNFLGFSPDNKTIVSVEFKSPVLIMYQTKLKTGEQYQTSYPISEYKWLNNWTHFKKPYFAPNIWIFNHIVWKKNIKGEYEMYVPKDSEISQ